MFRAAASGMVMDKAEIGSERHLFRRFVCLVSVVVLLTMAVYVSVNWLVQQREKESAVLSEARMLNVQAESYWKYIASIQDDINYDAEGNYEFKGVYCATAAKQMTEYFTQQADGYIIRYVRDNPRNPEDKADEFEMEAIELFRNGADEHYAMENHEGVPVFRYTAALRIEKDCLECHGDPVGSIDPTGGYREGMSLGDLGGVTSIIIPLDVFHQQASQRFACTIGFFVVLLVAIAAVLAFGLRAWVLNPIRRANYQLGKENEAKDEFLATVSHELRTPLAAIIAYTEIWKKTRDCSDPQQKLIAEEISKNSNVLLGMVNNIIDSARVNAGRYELEFEEVDLYDLVNSVADFIKPLASEKGIRINVMFDSDIPLVYGDWESLRKILSNLIGNAIKFSDTGDKVSIAVINHKKDGLVDILVSDSGCGIPPDELDTIFQKFKKSRAFPHRNQEGSGLGLYLSRRLAELMQGKLTVISELGVGSTFSLSIPTRISIDDEDNWGKAQ